MKIIRCKFSLREGYRALYLVSELYTLGSELFKNIPFYDDLSDFLLNKQS